MIDESKYTFRDATTSDIDFLAEVIIESKKGASDVVGMANLFDVSIEEFRGYVKQMLDEEIDGCDFSISSFIIAEYEGKPVSAFAGWVEGENEDEMPSAILKSNLIGYIFPSDKIQKAHENSTIVEGLQENKAPGTYQVEYGYTVPEHRGHHLIGKLIDAHIMRAKASLSKPTKMQVLVYEDNQSALTAYTKKGFKVVQHLIAKHPDILKFYPCDKEVVMEKEL